MQYFRLDGVEFDVAVESIEENFTILFSEETGRTMSSGARMSLFPLGTFYGHKVRVRRKNGKESDFDALWDYVSIPRDEGIFIQVAHNQETIGYDAYISNGIRKIKRIDESNGKILWDGMDLNIIPMEAQIKV